MSAITGLIHFNKEPINSEYISSLMDSFKQYPYDAIDIWKKDNVFLGCHAQWITPESVGEVVPYYDSERQLVITADAIIDNRKELFNILQVDHSQRKVMPDSQLILLAYAKWQEETPKHLVGDFAFMIWDERTQKLFGARDFSGSRTLYYYNGDNRFAFSTTIKPLFSLPYITKKLNEDWLAQFIAIPSMVEAADMQATVYKAIEQIPPSHSITVINGRITLSRYCTINVDKKLKLKTDGDYEEAFHDVFGRAVSDRIRTYGEVGSHLSGGLDSGTVASFAANQLKKEHKQLHTYSYIPEKDFKDWTPSYYLADESPFIKETVAHVGNINDHYMSFPGKSPYTEVDDFLELMEMPYKFFANTFWLKGINEEAQSKGIKIMLNGARGNHSISWGSLNLTYSHYTTLMKKLKWISLYRELGAYCQNFNTGKKVVVPFIAKRAFPKISQWGKRKQDSQFTSMINDEFARKTNVYGKLLGLGMDISDSVTNLTDYRKNYYQQLYPWNKSGVANTKMSLRYGVWDRDPTNDLRVIQFCLALPDKQYVQDGLERSFLRRVTKNALPDKVRLNQISRGFQGGDIIHRMANKWSSFTEEIAQMFMDDRIAELINIDAFKDSINKLSNQPHSELVIDHDFKKLTHCLILYRFIKSTT